MACECLEEVYRQFGSRRNGYAPQGPGCHDFHNNHSWKEPERLADAITPERIRDYFGTGKSPYGEVKEKAKIRPSAVALDHPRPTP